MGIRMKMERGDASVVRFVEGNATVSVWPGDKADGPVVYLNTFGEEGEHVYRELVQADVAPYMTLVAVSVPDWNHDMTPWDIPPVFKGDAACTGGADDYLGLLTGKILPGAEKEVPGRVAWRGIAGYSLAGLFAVYSLYRTEAFRRAASISGSLWFPDFREYVFSHRMKANPECIYFSLGNRECRTGNPYLKTVQERTEQIEAFYHGKGIDTIFQENPGGHGKNTARRTAAGIAWMVNRQSQTV